MIIALHGFLGLASDWSRFRGFRARDLWADVEASMKAPNAFEAWAEKFVSELDSELDSESNAERPWLLGYSMGGRLAMHALLHSPDRFSGAILVSSHPGLKGETERSTRRENDARWSSRFRSSESWQELMTAWNSQPVLKTPARRLPELERREADFDRARLAAALEIWSLGRQRDLGPALAELKVPILSLTGSEDSKFTSLVASLERPDHHEHVVIEGAGHRVPWDRPEEFDVALSTFLEAANKVC